MFFFQKMKIREHAISEIQTHYSLPRDCAAKSLVRRTNMLYPFVLNFMNLVLNNFASNISGARSFHEPGQFLLSKIFN